MVEFTDEVLIPAPIETAFAVALDIDAHQAAFRGSHERAVGGVTTGVIGLGEFVTWRARHFGITWTMTSRITEWDRPHRFVDEQQRGPFARFRHEHVFEPVEGGTRVTDLVSFEAPLGVLGRIAEALVLRRYMPRLIRIRNEFLVSAVHRPPEGADPVRRFPFHFEPRVARWARPFGIRPAAAFVELDGQDVTVRSGPWTVRTPVTNVRSVTVTGPYRAWRVAGPVRLSLADRGLTMATSTGPGLCLAFKEPVPGIDPFGLVRHPSVTCTVADVEGLLRALGSPPDAVPLRVERPRGTLLGTLRGLWSWVRRSESVVLEARAAEYVDVPADASIELPDGQPIDAGVGALFHRTYRTTVCGATLPAAQAMARIQADPNVIAAAGMAPFVKERGDATRLVPGDRFTLETAGPWSGPVEVVAVEELSFRLATLAGHMEAGLIEFRIDPGATDCPTLVIESWARSGDRLFDALYDRVRVGKAIQSETWAVAGERFAELTGGEVTGPFEIIEERTDAPD